MSSEHIHDWHAWVVTADATGTRPPAYYSYCSCGAMQKLVQGTAEPEACSAEEIAAVVGANVCRACYRLYTPGTKILTIYDDRPFALPGPRCGYCTGAAKYRVHRFSKAGLPGEPGTELIERKES